MADDRLRPMADERARPMAADRLGPMADERTLPSPVAWSPDVPEFEARVLRAFVRDGRLVSIPAQQRKRLVVYRYLLEQVLPDPAELVHERDLNMRLALLLADAATVRRALVDTGLARREGMVYQRAVPPRSGLG